MLKLWWDVVGCVQVVSAYNNITTLGSRLHDITADAAQAGTSGALQPQPQSQPQPQVQVQVQLQGQLLGLVEALRSQLQAAEEEETALAQLLAAEDAQWGLLELQLQAAQARQAHSRRAVAVVSRMQEEVLGMAESNHQSKQVRTGSLTPLSVLYPESNILRFVRS